jgi:hypothetical protein
MEEPDYNYQDADGYERGDMGRGKPKAKRIYHLDRIDECNNLAHLTSYDIWGKVYNEVFPLHTVEPIPPKAK